MRTSGCKDISEVNLHAGLTYMIKTNILIVGAGLVGLSFALSLKNAGFSICILENHLPEILTRSENNSRPISLSYGSVRILKALGIWDKLEKDACPILSVHVSEQGRFGSTHFSAQEQKVPALGYAVSFAKLLSTLYQSVASQNNIKIISIQSIKKIACDLTGAIVETNNSEIKTDLLVAADGTHSTCRDLLGIEFSEKDDGDIAKIFQLTLSENHDHTAYERFTKYGVLAILPLPEKNKAQLVWTITPRDAKKTAGWNDDNILLFLQETFEGRVSIADIKKIAQFPLKTTIAEKQITQSAVLLGNAAHTIYPIAAQGFNLGLHDVAILSDILMKAKKNIHDFSILEKYESDARKHQQAIFCITNQLTALFELPFIGGLRGLGLLTTDLINPIKNKLAKRTMGIARYAK